MKGSPPPLCTFLLIVAIIPQPFAVLCWPCEMICQQLHYIWRTFNLSLIYYCCFQNPTDLLNRSICGASIECEGSETCVKPELICNSSVVLPLDPKVYFGLHRATEGLPQPIFFIYSLFLYLKFKILRN